MYYIQSKKRLTQASYIKEDIQLLIKREKFNRHIKPNVSAYASRQTIGPYTFCTNSLTGISNFYVYQGNVCLAFLECHPYQITAGSNYQITVDCLIADFIWVDSSTVSATNILKELLNHGSLSNKKFSALLANYRITSSTFNAYYDLLTKVFTSNRCYIYDNSIDAVVQLPNTRLWYSFSSPRSRIASDIQLLICKQSYKRNLSTNTLDAYIKTRLKIRSVDKRKENKPKPAQPKILKPIPNTSLTAADWQAIPGYQQGPALIANSQLAAQCSVLSIGPNDITAFFKKKQYITAPLDEKTAKQIQPLVGNIPIMPGSIRFSKALQAEDRAYTLSFLAIPTGQGSLVNLVRIFIDK